MIATRFTTATLMMVAVVVAPLAAMPQLDGTYEIDYERSTIVAKLSKGGLLRFLGHEHGVVPGQWSAAVVIDPNDPQRSRIIVEIDALALLIDTAEARRLADIDPDGPSTDEIVEIRQRMLSAEQLDVAAFPSIRFRSTRMELGSGGMTLRGELTLHGVTNDVDVDSRLALEDGAWVVRGSLKISQKDYGIEPVSIGGVVKVADKIEIKFEIFAAASR